MLLHEAIQFAKEHVLITRKDIEVTSEAPKSVLYNGGGTWVKKEVGSFDVTIGNIKTDGAVVWKLNGILYLIGRKYDSKNISL